MSEFYKCAICGKIVKVIAEGRGQLVVAATSPWA